MRITFQSGVLTQNNSRLASRKVPLPSVPGDMETDFTNRRLATVWGVEFFSCFELFKATLALSSGAPCGSPLPSSNGCSPTATPTTLIPQPCRPTALPQDPHSSAAASSHMPELPPGALVTMAGCTLLCCVCRPSVLAASVAMLLG